MIIQRLPLNRIDNPDRLETPLPDIKPKSSLTSGQDNSGFPRKRNVRHSDIIEENE